MNTKAKITSEDDRVEITNDYCGHFEICEVHGTGDHPVVDVYDANALIRFKQGSDDWPEIRARELRDRELVNVTAGQSSYSEGVQDALKELRKYKNYSPPAGKSFKDILSQLEEKIEKL